MTKVACPENKVQTTECMTDRDYLNDVLSSLKQITQNTAIAIYESSNIDLKNKLKNIFDTVEQLQRETYELAWNNGWYNLEKAPTTKINETYNNLNKRYNELEDI